MSDYGLRRHQGVAVGERGIASVLVVGLNQTIDRTIRLGALAPGQVLRATEVAVTPGGKAVNVCRAALTLDHPAPLVGPFPGRLGRVATELLAAEGLEVTAVPVDGEIRGTTVVIEANGRTTVINEPGPPLGGVEWDDVVAAVAESVGAGAVVAISGSVPPGVADGAHRTLIELVHDHGAAVAVDVTGPRLIEAASAGADLVSPNLAEAEQALGANPPTQSGEAVDLDDLARDDVATRARAAAAALLSTGARAAMVSAGRHGVACLSDTVDVFVSAPVVDVVNPIGAGDALLGATLVAIERGRTLDVAVRDGVAYAAASVAHPVAGYADPTLVAELAGERVR
jgi:1-phosphofructokinase family hexose kinase